MLQVLPLLFASCIIEEVLFASWSSSAEACEPFLTVHGTRSWVFSGPTQPLFVSPFCSWLPLSLVPQSHLNSVVLSICLPLSFFSYTCKIRSYVECLTIFIYVNNVCTIYILVFLTYHFKDLPCDYMFMFGIRICLSNHLHNFLFS